MTKKKEYKCSPLLHMPGNPDHNFECKTKGDTGDITLNLRVDRKTGKGIVTSGGKVGGRPATVKEGVLGSHVEIE